MADLWRVTYMGDGVKPTAVGAFAKHVTAFTSEEFARSVAGEEGWLFTGRLSLKTHPWLRDHVVMDAALLPSTAFVELALAAAKHVGAGQVEDLTLVAPLVLDGERALQVTVAEPDEDGRRPLNVYSRAQSGAGEQSDDRAALVATG